MLKLASLELARPELPRAATTIVFITNLIERSENIYAVITQQSWCQA